MTTTLLSNPQWYGNCDVPDISLPLSQIRLDDEIVAQVYQYCTFANDTLAGIARMLYQTRQMQYWLSRQIDFCSYHPIAHDECRTQIQRTDQTLTLTLLELLQGEGLLDNNGSVSLTLVAQRSQCLLNGEPWYPKI